MTRTDTLYERLLEENPGNLIHLEEMLHHARQMEQERDKLQEELMEWRPLCLWGGTPEHIHQFIKGQQARIRQTQDIEAKLKEAGESCTMWIKSLGEAREERDNLKQELEIVTARLHGKKHPLDNGIPEQHEIYIFKNGKYELDT